MMQNTAAWGTSLFTFPHPIGFSTSLNDRGTASAEGEATCNEIADARSVGLRQRPGIDFPAQVKGACLRAGLCGQAGTLNAWSPCREPDALGPARDAAIAVPPSVASICHLKAQVNRGGPCRDHLAAIPRRAARGLGGEAARCRAALGGRYAGNREHPRVTGTTPAYRY